MRAGPKVLPTGFPAWKNSTRSLPKAGSARVAAFVGRYCRTPKGTRTLRAGSPMKLLVWQAQAVEGIYGATPRPRQALVSIARKNGKSQLAAALALYHLTADGEESAEVLIASSDERTAMVTFNMARRMVELSPLLSGICQTFRDKIYVPETDSSLDVLSGVADRAQGRGPSFAVLDEVHVSSPDLWDALALGQAARARPTLLGISTQGPPDPDNLMSRLSEYGRDGCDPGFYFQEHAAPAGCALDDPEGWKAANPAYEELGLGEHLAALSKTTREQAFRRFHLNQSVAQDGAWMPLGAWAACAEQHGIPDGAPVTLAVDGSYNGDCTAIVAATVSPRPHLDAVAWWKPSKDEPVDVLAVEDAIRAACRRWRVREVLFDPYRFARTIAVLAAERLPVVEFPQSAARMTPATTGLYEAVVNRQVTHSGHPELARHVANAVIREDARGTRIGKQSKDSPRKIDLAVCAIMAHSRALHLATHSPARRRVAAFR